MADFPRVVGDGYSRSLRFTTPKISFAPDTIAFHEERAGVPYLLILEHVVEGSDERQPKRVSESTAQGMLFYLSNLWGNRSKIGAIQPPINSSMVTYWRRRYAFFDDTCADFEEELADGAEQELYERAVLGQAQPVVINGAVEYIDKKSDDLLKYFLTHNRPKRYSQKTESKVTQKTELSGPNGGPLAVVDRSSLRGLSDEELAKLEQLLSKGVE